MLSAASGEAIPTCVMSLKESYILDIKQVGPLEANFGMDRASNVPSQHFITSLVISSCLNGPSARCPV